MKDDDFTIRPLPKQDSGKSKIPINLPRGNLVIVGPSGSGKSTLLINLILRKKFGYIEEYDKIIIFTPTLFLDNSWQLVLEYNQKKNPKKYAEIILHDEYDEEEIEDIFTLQEQTDKSERPKILIILDDVADQLQAKSNSLLIKTFFKGRHYNISCWISSQSYKAVPRSVRVNSSFIFLNINPNERSMISQELSREDKTVFLRKLEHCLSEKYSFIYLNMKETVQKMYCKNFKEFIE